MRTNNALVQAFNVNNLNELTTNSGTLTVAGTTTSPATNVTVIAKDSYGRSATNSISFNLPATNSYAYDLNGNLTSDGTRGFAYDDENELIRVTVTNAWKSEFTYDGKLRRRVRKEYTWQSSAWLLLTPIRFI